MKIKKAYLHIGMPKTGSTALQVFFSKNVTSLKEDGISYPEFNTPEIGNATSFVGPLVGENGPILSSPAYSLDTFGKYLSKEDSDILLSSEWFIVLDTNTLIKIKKLLECYNFKPIIICYIRRRDYDVESRYCQSFKYKRIDFFCDELVVHQTYVNTIDKFSNVFDKINLIVRCYEKVQFIDGDIFHDFLYLLDIKNISKYHIPTTKINASPPKYFTNFLRICNKHFNVPDYFQQLLIQIGDKLGSANIEDKVQWLSPQKRSNIVKQFQEQDRTIAKDYLGRKDGILFYEPLPNPDDKWENPYTFNGEDAVKAILPILMHLVDKVDKLSKSRL